MDWNKGWIETQQELSEASKADHFWRTMTLDMRAKMTAAQYRQKRAAALKRLREADKARHCMIRERRWEALNLLTSQTSRDLPPPPTMNA